MVRGPRRCVIYLLSVFVFGRVCCDLQWPIPYEASPDTLPNIEIQWLADEYKVCWLGVF